METVSPPGPLRTNLSRDSTLVNVFASTTTTASVDSQDESTTETELPYSHPSKTKTKTFRRKSKSTTTVITAVGSDSDSQSLRRGNNGSVELKQARPPVPPSNSSVNSTQKTTFSSMFRRRMKSLANILSPPTADSHQTSDSPHRHESTFKKKKTISDSKITDEVNSPNTNKEHEIETIFSHEEREIKLEFTHEEHEVHVFSKNLVKDIEADKAKYEADGALIVKGSASVVSGDVLGGGVPIAEGALELVGAFVKDAAEAFVQTKEGEAKDPSAVANSKAVKAALTAERVLDNIAKDVDPLAKGITEIVKGDVVGGAEALTQVTAQIGADVVVPVVDAVSGPNSVIASEVDKLAPELVKDVGAAANSIGSIVQKKTAAGVGSLVDTLQQVDTDVSGAKSAPVSVPTTIVSQVTPVVATAAGMTSASATSASPSVTIASAVAATISTNSAVAAAPPKSDQDLLDIAHSVVDAVNNIKAHYGADSVTSHEIERLAVLMLKQILSVN
ncbi:hypothetical protein HK100_003808 [Physocladia obscura]|uniref:Uncharacterized protein n=1 Tax=Physocladia obscura TaxID=109957 RepID=A0AAD5T7H0_9FUNG|nr:hypothetical protein HK100_003808 [Physocladia obscura]